MQTPEPSSPPATRPTPSIWRLIFQGYCALIITSVLGLLAAAPVINSQVRYFSEMTILVGASQSYESQLTAWALAQPRVLAFTTERRGEDLWFRTEYQGSPQQQPPQPALAAKMRELGYEFRGMRGGRIGMLSGLGELISNPLALATMLAGMQFAFAFVGLNRIRAARIQGEAVPPLFPGNHGRSVLLGTLGGIGLMGLGLLYEQLVTAWLGMAAPSPWDATTKMETQTKLVFLIFGGLGAPIAEEIFFRGYLFGKFKRAGYVGFGMIFTGFLFGIVHFSDGYNVPAIFLFGVILAWLYHRTNSLLAPIAAHIVNNGVAILWMIGA